MPLGRAARRSGQELRGSLSSTGGGAVRMSRKPPQPPEYLPASKN
jgi:hypothetical protein